MDDLAFLHGRIESYADYTNDTDRHLADEQIRAYVGESLARVLERLAPSGTTGEALARILLRCQFADQRIVRALDVDDPNDIEVTSLHAADRELVTLGDRADALSAPDVDAFLALIDAAFDRRSRIVISGAATSQTPPR